MTIKTKGTGMMNLAKRIWNDGKNLMGKKDMTWISRYLQFKKYGPNESKVENVDIGKRRNSLQTQSGMQMT